MFELKRILKTIDLAKSDDRSIADCFALAAKFAAEIHLLHVVPENAIPIFGSQKRLSQSLEQLTKLSLPANDARVIREVRMGRIVECIQQYVEEQSIDLLMLDKFDLTAHGTRASMAIVSELRDKLSIPILLTDSAGSLESNTMVRATRTLIEKLGTELEGNQQDTLQAMTHEIECELGLSNGAAEKLVTQMQDMQVLEWKDVEEGHADSSSPGHWQIEDVYPQPEDFSPVYEVGFDAERTSAVSLIQRAIEVGATDIHIDPAGTAGYTVQFRIDGRMYEFCRLQQHIAGVTMKQIKLLANISLADPFHPSESRLEMPVSIPNHEVRVTTSPVADGEAIAMRIIDGRKLSLPLGEIGFSEQTFAAVQRMLNQRSGLVLIAGPTGAGKTTTAYSILRTLFNQQKKIISVEDPVELVVSFMRQLNVDKRHGISMQSCLATILRMDPDAVFIGEIRNAEAAQIAMQAASCGKRTISTIHLKDISSTVAAMREFAIDGRTLADGLAGVIAQRLVRRLCQSCSERSPVTPEEVNLFLSQEIEPPIEVGRARGCRNCRGTGYLGRIGIFEAVVVEDDFAEAIRQEQHVSDLRKFVRTSGASLLADGLQKVFEGITTIEELQDVSSLENVTSSLSLSDRNESVAWRTTP